MCPCFGNPVSINQQFPDGHKKSYDIINHCHFLPQSRTQQWMHSQIIKTKRNVKIGLFSINSRIVIFSPIFRQSACPVLHQTSLQGPWHLNDPPLFCRRTPNAFELTSLLHNLCAYLYPHQ